LLLAVTIVILFIKIHSCGDYSPILPDEIELGAHLTGLMQPTGGLKDQAAVKQKTKVEKLMERRTLLTQRVAKLEAQIVDIDEEIAELAVDSVSTTQLTFASVDADEV
jgi:hypothetical protein